MLLGECSDVEGGCLLDEDGIVGAAGIALAWIVVV
jgi:hypothetical protein